MPTRFRLNHQRLKLQFRNLIQKHWLDLIVIGVIITALATLLWLRSQRQTQWILVQVKVSQEEWWWQGTSPEYWYGQNLQLGAKGQNSFGETVAEIVKVELTDVGLARNQVQVWAKLKVSYDPKTNQYIFGFQPLQVGRGLELNFGSQQIKGLVVDVNRDPPQTVERLVQLKLFEVDPKVAQSLTLGLENKNSAGEILAKITTLNVGQTVRSEFSDIRGRMLVVADPNYVQVETVVKMRLLQDGNRYVTADGQAVKVGTEISVQFPQTVLLKALVLDIQPVSIK